MSKYSDCETKVTVNGRETTTKYKRNGKHVATKIEMRDTEGKLVQRQWYDKARQLHSKYEPADVRNGIYCKSYWHGRFHSYGGNASIIESFGNWTTPEEFTGRALWHKYGELHRKDGPAVMEYENGNPVCAKWYDYGELHREVGPAVMFMQDESIHNSWYKNGIEITGELIEPMRVPPEISEVFKILPQPIMEAFVEHYWHWEFYRL